MSSLFLLFYIFYWLVCVLSGSNKFLWMAVTKSGSIGGYITSDLLILVVIKHDKILLSLGIQNLWSPCIYLWFQINLKPRNLS